MDYYAGLDVSLRSVAICVIDAGGRTVFERSVACEVEDISQCLAGFEISRALSANPESFRDSPLF